MHTAFLDEHAVNYSKIRYSLISWVVIVHWWLVLGVNIIGTCYCWWAVKVI